MASTDGALRARQWLMFATGVAVGAFWFVYPVLNGWGAYRVWDQNTESSATRPWFKVGVIVGFLASSAVGLLFLLSL
jgi:hypothetical protein